MLKSSPGMVIKGDLTVKQVLLNKKTVSAATGLATALSALSTFPARAQVGDGIADASGGQETSADLPEILQRVINVLLFIVGAAAVIMLIVGAVRYTVSAGDQQAVANAKNTILYAIVGIVVAVLAFAAVQFVFETLTDATG